VTIRDILGKRILPNFSLARQEQRIKIKIKIDLIQAEWLLILLQIGVLQDLTRLKMRVQDETLLTGAKMVRNKM
jgi:hypothetical protein